MSSAGRASRHEEVAFARAAGRSPNGRATKALELSGGVIDHQLHQLRDLLSSEIAGVRDVRFSIWRVHKRSPLGRSTGAQTRHHDVAECGRDDGGCPVTYSEGDTHRLVVDVYLRREGKLLGAEVMLKFLEEPAAPWLSCRLAPERPYGTPVWLEMMEGSPLGSWPHKDGIGLSRVNIAAKELVAQVPANPGGGSIGARRRQPRTKHADVN
jgi:hypothetical protein